MSVSAFLSTSALAKGVMLPSRVVVKRDSLSPKDILAINEKGFYEYGAFEEKICELEVNGEVIARGKIIRKAGKSYFKVLEMNQATEGFGKESAE